MSADGPRTGLVRAIGEELVKHLDEFVRDGTTHAVDLRALPLTVGDVEDLRALLGRGEVRVELDVAGPSTVYETGFPGVWWIQHRSLTGEVLTETLEITSVPSVVRTPPGDAVDSSVRLRHALNAQQEA